ncbi:MAG: hypothetical protein ACP5J6_10380 [Candidatus Saccharicenans sp.]
MREASEEAFGISEEGDGFTDLPWLAGDGLAELIGLAAVVGFLGLAELVDLLVFVGLAGLV